jgi:hypothetical protein
VSAALDPLDPDDFRVLWDASDEWGRARLLERAEAGDVSAASLTAAS